MLSLLPFALPLATSCSSKEVHLKTWKDKTTGKKQRPCVTHVTEEIN